VILKTTKSAFTGYIKNKPRPRCPKALTASLALAQQQPGNTSEPQDYAALRASALTTLLKVFAEHDSLSVQHTLFDIGKAMLQSVPEMARVKLTMPNLHCNLVDLSRFGQDNPNQIFVPIDEPHGYIEAVIER
jgi:urate oxidase